ncbi:MAG: helix-turn-helix transcriptional regulator [Clostridia bacterium]
MAKFIELRKKIGAQVELANLVGVTQSTIASWEAGASYPRRAMLQKLSKTFGVSGDDILEAIDNSKK